MDGFCDVNGCTNETFMGWAPIGEQKGRQICEYHFRRHDNPEDSFNLWNAFGFKRPVQRLKQPAQRGPRRCDCVQALAMTKQIVNPKHQMIPTTSKSPGCRTCGAPREPEHTYCKRCGKERKAESNRQRQKRHYYQGQKPNAFVPI